NQPEQAFLPLRRTAEIYEKLLGDHPSTGSALNRLGEAYLSRTDPTALTVLDKALKVNTKVLGPEHPETQISMKDLGVAHFNNKDFAAAIATHTKVLEIRERLLGPDHPHTILSVSAMAATYQAANEDAKAIPYYERVLKYREKMFPTPDKETV